MKSSAQEQEKDHSTSSGIEPKIPLWVLALSTTLGMQSVASFLDQSLPIIAPLLTARAGLAPERIGIISSLSALGVILFLVFGGPVLARLGPVRMLQIGTLTAVCGLAIAATGWWPLLVIAAIMMGFGYGPSPPAGNRILAATVPARHRSLIFSIKQAGAPLGSLGGGHSCANRRGMGLAGGARDFDFDWRSRCGDYHVNSTPAEFRARA